MTATEKHNDIGYYIKCAIGLFLMFGFGRLCPPLFGLPEVGMQVVGIFIGLIW